MTNDSNKTEWIELYLKGGLDSDQLNKFIAKFEQEEDFRQEVEQQRDLLKKTQKAGQEDLKRTLKEPPNEWKSNHENEWLLHDKDQKVKENEWRVRRPKGSRFAYMIAASLIFFMLLGIVMYSTVSKDQLYNQKIELYDQENKNKAENVVFSEIVKGYHNKEFISTINLYTHKTTPSVEEIFLTGNAYLALSQFEQAIKMFKKVIEKNEALPQNLQKYYEEAQFFLALSYLKIGAVKKSRSLFIHIDNQANHVYKDRITPLFLFKLKLLELKTH